MKTIDVSFSGGPLDGKARRELIPEHWKFLRIEHQLRDRVHVYFGAVPDDTGATLEYLGLENQEVQP